MLVAPSILGGYGDARGYHGLDEKRLDGPMAGIVIRDRRNNRIDNMYVMY
jgi:hypothetical protein